MASRTQTQAHTVQTQQSGVLSECAATMATLVEQMRQVTANLGHITDIIFGNGKLGLQDKTDDNSRALEAIIKLLDEMRDSKKAEETRRQQEALDRRNDMRKWWLGVGTAVVVAVIAILQDITTQTALAKLMTLVNK